MCKVLMMTGIKHPDKAWEFVKASKEFMSLNDRDGLGYAAVNKDGNLFSERWLINNDGFEGDPSSESDKMLIEKLGAIVKTTGEGENYSSYGDLDYSNVRTLLMHTRMATCAKSFENVHPFIIDDNALIHNGVLSNATYSSDLENKISTCDSETALNRYLADEINTRPDNVQEFIDYLKGYWAFGFISRDANGRRIFDVTRTDTRGTSGNLYVTYVEQIGAYVYCTTDTIISKTLDKLKWVHANKIFPTNPHVLTRHDAITGEVLLSVEHDASVLNKTTPSGGSSSGSGSSNGWSSTNYSATGNGYSSDKKKSTTTSTTYDKRHTPSQFPTGSEESATTKKNILTKTTENLNEMLATDSKYYDDGDGIAGVAFDWADGRDDEFEDMYGEEEYSKMMMIYDGLPEELQNELDVLPVSLMMDELYWLLESKEYMSLMEEISNAKRA